MDEVVFKTLLSTLDDIAFTYGEGKEGTTPREVKSYLVDEAPDTDEKRLAATVAALMLAADAENFIAEAQVAMAIADISHTPFEGRYDAPAAREATFGTVATIGFALKLAAAMEAQDAVVLTEEQTA